MHDVPYTADETNLSLYIAMLLITMFIMIVIGIYGFVFRKGKVVDDNDNKEFTYTVGSDEKKNGITLRKEEQDSDKAQFGVTISMENIEDINSSNQEKK